MANQQRQGTGRHGHKDTQEPWPHTQGSQREQSQGDERQQSQSRSGGGRQQQQGASGSRQQQQQQQDGGSMDRSERESLKAREYRDENGEIHHHTNTYMEQHGKEGGRQER